MGRMKEEFTKICCFYENSIVDVCKGFGCSLKPNDIIEFYDTGDLRINLDYIDYLQKLLVTVSFYSAIAKVKGYPKDWCLDYDRVEYDIYDQELEETSDEMYKLDLIDPLRHYKMELSELQ